MKRLVLALAATVLLLPTAALAKGPSAATIDGPGAGGGITFSGTEGSGPLGALTEQSGWFAAAFAQEPSPLLAERPNGDLGRKYTVTYTVPTDMNRTVTIKQDIYPYANPGPVTYMAPGQPIFDMKTRGGWFQAGPELKRTLVAAGLPETASTASIDDSSFPTVTVTSIALALMLLAATALVRRRRARPAPAG